MLLFDKERHWYAALLFALPLMLGRAHPRHRSLIGLGDR